jgi:hypothetical protein
MLINNGSKAVTIQRDIDASLIGAINAYNSGMMDWYTSDGRQKNDLLAPFDLAPNETLYVDVKFTALDVGRYDAQIEYMTSIGTVYSNLVGRGKVFRIVTEIPKNYQADPGGSVEITYLIRKAEGETGTFEEAGIDEFKIFVSFKDDSRGDAQDVYPAVESCDDINTTGTLLQDFTCNYTKIVTDKQTNAQFLQLYYGGDPNNPQTISGDGPMFRFTMKAYLSDLNVVPLPQWFEVLGTPANYVIVDTIPGSINITPVCVNTLRLIQLSNVNYQLQQNVPNPASGNVTINYSVGLEANTTITLYNSSGDKVATLIDQVHKPGKYEISFDADALGLSSGAYFYEMVSGPFTDTKTMIIQK